VKAQGWSWRESVFDLMTRVSGSDGGSNPTGRRKVAGSTPVPTLSMTSPRAGHRPLSDGPAECPCWPLQPDRDRSSEAKISEQVFVCAGRDPFERW